MVAREDGTSKELWVRFDTPPTAAFRSGDRQRLKAAFEVVEGGGMEGRTLEKFPRRLAAFGGEAAVL